MLVGGRGEVVGHDLEEELRGETIGHAECGLAAAGCMIRVILRKKVRQNE